MQAEPVIEVRNVSKRFCRDGRKSLRYGLADMVGEFLPSRAGKPSLREGEFFAVKDLSFSIRPGEAIAIAGRNGAGKTTLLRMIAGLLKPDTGEIHVRGKVNPVIELGRGLDTQLTGRENARLGLVWRGIPLRETSELTTAIAEFSELGEMFDVPVAHYSSGMRARLAFAISAHVPCDLMLIDEVLAVGDLAFQNKCARFMRQHLERGGSLLFVSHDPIQMQAVCRRGILIEGGGKLYDGLIDGCIDLLMKTQLSDQTEATNGQTDRSKSHIVALDIVDAAGVRTLASGEDMTVRLVYKSHEAQRLRCAVEIWTRDLQSCVTIVSRKQPYELLPGEGEILCTFPQLPLVRGEYCLRAALFDEETLMGVTTWGHENAPTPFDITEPLDREILLSQQFRKLIHLPCEWHHAGSIEGGPDETAACRKDDQELTDVA